jgi:hypothetical protein
MNALTVKPGVLFLETLSGGVLLDVAANRFLGLSTLSAVIWRDLMCGKTRQATTASIANLRGVPDSVAAAILDAQLKTWERTELISASEQLSTSVRAKTSGTKATSEMSALVLRSASSSVHLYCHFTFLS